MDNLARHLNYSPPQDNPYEDEVFNTVGLDIDNPIDYHLMMEEAYDMSSGIYPYYEDTHITRPLAVVAYHSKEDRMSGTLLDRWLKRYSELSIMSEFGIPFDAFLQMDMESVANIYAVAREVAERKRKLAEKALAPMSDKDSHDDLS